MKFVLEDLKNGCRLGQLMCIKNGKDRVIPTPTCMLYTRGGNAPYLTGDILQKMKTLPDMFHFPLPTLVNGREAITHFKRGITNMADVVNSCSLSYISFQDPANAVPGGFNEKTGSSVWSKGGRLKVDVDEFIKLQAAFKPDIYQAMCDGDTNKDSGNKRVMKSLDRTLSFLDKIIEKHKENKALEETAIFGTVVGGYKEEDRVRCAKETASRPVDGFCIEGFHNHGPSTENIDFADINGILQQTLAELPDTKPRVMHHVWTPSNVFYGIKCGLDIFDSSYTHVVTERGCALVFNFTLPHVGSSESVDDPPANPNGTAAASDAETFELNLKDERYKDDLSPILASCSCYTCTTHTRAYVCHLLTTKEIVARILLTIHNVHHYSSFFQAVRHSLEADRFEELQFIIEQQKQ